MYVTWFSQISVEADEAYQTEGRTKTRFCSFVWHLYPYHLSAIVVWTQKRGTAFVQCQYQNQPVFSLESIKAELHKKGGPHNITYNKLSAPKIGCSMHISHFRLTNNAIRLMAMELDDADPQSQTAATISYTTCCCIKGLPVILTVRMAGCFHTSFP